MGILAHFADTAFPYCRKKESLHGSPFAYMSRGSEKDAAWPRAFHYKKEKPAVRDMLTAGVELVDGFEPPTC